MYARPEVIYGQTPAAGGGFSLSNPPQGENLGDSPECWRLVVVSFELTTDGTAGNRFVSVAYSDGSVDYCRSGTQLAVAASTAPARFVFAAHRGQSEWNTHNDVFAPLEPVVFGAGHRLRIDVDGAKAGDQLDKIALVYERLREHDAAR